MASGARHVAMSTTSSCGRVANTEAGWPAKDARRSRARWCAMRGVVGFVSSVVWNLSVCRSASDGPVVVSAQSSEPYTETRASRRPAGSRREQYCWLPTGVCRETPCRNLHSVTPKQQGACVCACSCAMCSVQFAVCCAGCSLLGLTAHHCPLPTSI